MLNLIKNFTFSEKKILRGMCCISRCIALWGIFATAFMESFEEYILSIPRSDARHSADNSSICSVLVQILIMVNAELIQFCTSKFGNSQILVF